ncbi:MAG: NusG domain II-containing protein [Magnetococcus sp. MYC-9]
MTSMERGGGEPLQGVHLLQRATTVADRWLILCTALLITGCASYLALRPAGQRAIVQRDNQTVRTLALDNNQQMHVEGRLGPVLIQVQDGRVRLLEYASPRMIGTRSGWIATAGSMVACVPCGILIRVEGGDSVPTRSDALDGITR